MKVFKIYSDGCYYGIAALTEQEAKECFAEEINDDITSISKIEEVPESQWDKRDITIHEDNDPERASWKVSIRESLSSDNEPEILFSNDSNLWS